MTLSHHHHRHNPAPVPMNPQQHPKTLQHRTGTASRKGRTAKKAHASRGVGKKYWRHKPRPMTTTKSTRWLRWKLRQGKCKGARERRSGSAGRGLTGGRKLALLLQRVGGGGGRKGGRKGGREGGEIRGMSIFFRFAPDLSPAVTVQSRTGHSLPTYTYWQGGKVIASST